MAMFFCLTFGLFTTKQKLAQIPLHGKLSRRHRGFGLGLERTVAWLCGTPHIRECIPFPRLMNRLRP